MTNALTVKYLKARGYIVAIIAAARAQEKKPVGLYPSLAEYYLYGATRIIADIDSILKTPHEPVEAIDWETVRVKRKQSLNMLRSLFHDLEEAHKAVGDEAFGGWCADNFVPLRVVFKMAKLLPDSSFAGHTKEVERIHKLFRRARDIEIFSAQADKSPRPARAKEAPNFNSAALKAKMEAARAQADKPKPSKPSPDDPAALKARIVALEAEVARLSAGRSKAGRKAIFGKPMTAAERMRRMRARR